MNHLMLDLETEDTRPSATIVSIGMVLFDPNESDGKIVKLPALYPDRNQQRSVGRTYSQSTLDWWAQQSPAAKTVFQHPQEDCRDVIAKIVGAVDPINGMQVTHVWGNGVGFDNTILRSFFESFNAEAPWPFWQDYDFRTLKAMPGAKGLAPSFVGIPHDAVDDAYNQARHLQIICKHFNLNF